MPGPIDFLLVTPLAEERDAVLSRLPGYRKVPPSDHDVRVYYAAELPVTFSDGSKSLYSVVVLPLSKMGHTEASNAAVDGIRAWQPRYVIVVGIAGGVAGGTIRLGDVLIAKQVADYELAKITGDYTRIRWQAHPVDQRLLIAAQNFFGTEWVKTTALRFDDAEPQVHIGPICTGNKVLAKRELVDQLGATWHSLIGVEMEAGGVVNAVSQAVGRPGFFMVRGVSDLADENKDKGDVTRWRQYACEIAASWTISFLKDGPVPIDAAAKGPDSPLPNAQPQPLVTKLVAPDRRRTEALKAEQRRLKRLSSTVDSPPSATNSRLEELAREIGHLEKQDEQYRLDEASRATIFGDRFEYIAEVGSGGFAKVWAAYDHEYDRNVAIKVLHRHLQDNVEHRKRFRREARYMQKLDSCPNIVRVYETRTDYDKDDERHHDAVAYYVMELVEGSTDILAAAGRGDIKLAFDLFRQACKGISFAHTQSIIHRDIKPHNLLVSMEREPTVKICDFGVAKARGTIRYTSDTTTFGTLGYSAPEQLKARQQDMEAGVLQDVFSLGMVLYALLTRREVQPTTWIARKQVRQAIIEAMVPHTTIPGKFADLVLRAIAEDPTDRFASVDELSDHLDVLHDYVNVGSDVEGRSGARIFVSSELVRFVDGLKPGPTLTYNFDGALDDTLANLLVYLTTTNVSAFVLDFNGNLIDRASDLFPKNMTNRVLYADPADVDYAIGVNPLRFANDHNRESFASLTANALEIAMGSPLRGGQHALLQDALRLLSYLPNGTLSMLEQIFTFKDYRKSILNRVKSTEARGFMEFSRQFPSGQPSARARHLGQALTRIFSHRLYTHSTSQPVPRCAILPTTFATNKITLVDFRSNQFADNQYISLFLLLWAELTLSETKPTADSYVLINGADRLDRTSWAELAHLTNNAHTLLVCNDMPAEAKTISLAKYSVRYIVHHRSFGHPAVPLLPRSPPPQDHFAYYGADELDHFDCYSMRLVFHENYTTASFELIKQLSRERLAVERGAHEGKLERYLDKALEDPEQRIGIGADLQTLLGISRLPDEAFLPLGLVAMKSGYFGQGRELLNRALVRDPANFRPYFDGFVYHSEAGLYDHAFDYATRIVTKASTLPSITTEQSRVLLSTIRRAFSVLVYDIRDVRNGNKNFLTALQAHFLTMDEQSLAGPLFYNLRARIYWFLDRTRGVGDFERAIELDSTMHSINTYATWLKDVDGDLEASARLYRAGLQQFPDDAQLLHNLALVILEKAEHTETPELLVEVQSLLDKASRRPMSPRLRVNVEVTTEALRRLQRMPKWEPTSHKLTTAMQRQARHLLRLALAELDYPAEVEAAKLNTVMERLLPGFLEEIGVPRFRNLLQLLETTTDVITGLREEANGMLMVTINRARVEEQDGYQGVPAGTQTSSTPFTTSSLAELVRETRAALGGAAFISGTQLKITMTRLSPSFQQEFGAAKFKDVLLPLVGPSGPITKLHVKPLGDMVLEFGGEAPWEGTSPDHAVVLVTNDGDAIAEPTLVELDQDDASLGLRTNRVEARISMDPTAFIHAGGVEEQISTDPTNGSPVKKKRRRRRKMKGLLQIEAEAAAIALSANTAQDIERARQMVEAALTRSTHPMKLGDLAHMIRREMGEFGRSYGGAPSFKVFLATLRVPHLEMSNVPPGFAFLSDIHEEPRPNDPQASSTTLVEPGAAHDGSSGAGVVKECPNCGHDIMIRATGGKSVQFFYQCESCFHHLLFRGRSDTGAFADLGDGNTTFTCPHCNQMSSLWLAPGRVVAFKAWCKRCMKALIINGSLLRFTASAIGEA